MYHLVGNAIPELTFGTPHQVFDEGRTKPILFQMEQEGAPAGLWVVKASDKRPSGLLVELACSDLCAYFGMHTPEVAVARFPDAVLDYDANPAGVAARAMHHRNRNEVVFCSRFVELGTRLTPENLKWPRGDQDEHVMLLFLFDVLLWHHDRTVENPNALRADGKIIAIDHGRAMFGIEETDETGLGPDFSQTRTDDWPRHVVFETLRRRWQKPGARAAMEQFERRASALNAGVLGDFARGWPPALDKGGMRGEIFRFVLERCRVYPDISREIRAAFEPD